MLIFKTLKKGKVDPINFQKILKIMKLKLLINLAIRFFPLIFEEMLS